jgi:hypothetical protein
LTGQMLESAFTFLVQRLLSTGIRKGGRPRSSLTGYRRRYSSRIRVAMSPQRPHTSPPLGPRKTGHRGTASIRCSSDRQAQLFCGQSWPRILTSDVTYLFYHVLRAYKSFVLRPGEVGVGCLGWLWKSEGASRADMPTTDSLLDLSSLSEQSFYALQYGTLMNCSVRIVTYISRTVSDARTTNHAEPSDQLSPCEAHGRSIPLMFSLNWSLEVMLRQQS